MRNATNEPPHGHVVKVSGTTSHYGETILTCIAREYGPLRHASKILAKHARSSYRTAEGWLAGRHVPTGANLLNLMDSCEVLADEINRAIAEHKRRGNK